MTTNELEAMFYDDSIVIELTVLYVKPVDVSGWVTEDGQRHNAKEIAELNNLPYDGRLVDTHVLNEEGRDFLINGAQIRRGASTVIVRPFTAIVPVAIFESGWDNTWDSKTVKIPVALETADGEKHLKVVRAILNKGY